MRRPLPKPRFSACLGGLVLLLIAGFAVADGPHGYRDANFDYFVSGDPALPRAAHTEFGLALMGGGGSVDAAFRFIATKAGAGHIVILRAVSDNSFDPKDGNYGEFFASKWGPVASAETIVFHNRAAASDARVIAALKNADGIFIAGGDQANYVRYWKGTPVQDLLNAHVRANRPIGGSSAGLAVLGGHCYTALDGGSLESKAALADPLGRDVTLDGDFLHFRWLENVVTDTHFSARHRLGRLITFVARLDHRQSMAAGAQGAVYGVGIDERTALLIGADGVGRLAAGSAGSAWFVMPHGPAPALAKDTPLSVAQIHLERLDTGGSFDFSARRIEQPADSAIVTLKDGKLVAPSIASPILLRDKAPKSES